MTVLRVLLVLFMIGTLGADGASFKMGADWPRIAERDQTALITHADGRQRMALAVRLDLAATESGIWLVPVRGRPDQVNVDLARDMPWMRGGIVDPPKAARERLIHTTTTISAFLVPGVPFPLIGLAVIPNLMESRVTAASAETTIRADGLAATVLPAEKPEQLALRLAGLGRPVPPDRLAGFAPYADGGHSIIAVRLDPEAKVDQDRWRDRSPALLLDFPSAEPWFPLRASIGGGQTRVHLQLAGWWTSAIAKRGPRAVVPIWGSHWNWYRNIPESELRSDGFTSGHVAVCTWLSIAPEKPTQRATRIELRLEENTDFANDLTFAPDLRPALERGVSIMSIPDSFWGAWITVLVLGAFSGAYFSRRLLGKTSWGLWAGSTMAIGGGFGPWLVARFWCGNRLKIPSPLHLGTAVMVTIVVIFVFIMLTPMAWSLSMQDGWRPIMVFLTVSILASLHAVLWCRWGRSGKQEGQVATNRLLAAWAYATPSAVIAVLALLAAIGLLWLEGRWF